MAELNSISKYDMIVLIILIVAFFGLAAEQAFVNIISIIFIVVFNPFSISPSFTKTKMKYENI